ncbi:DNA adenine methylase [Cuniculiplasma sp. SKW3]|uniref:DNA adenine methylase n=1 Tax=Cuniculiplasma sp. SKW3 TaxID=3400170 RepID=UPI003FD4F144
MEYGEMRIDLLSTVDIPQFRFIGSKYRLINYLSEILQREDLYRGTFLDGFSGSAVVGRGFKKYFPIISNDALYFSYVLQRALIGLNEYPKFQSVDLPDLSNSNEMRINQILYFLSNIDGIDGFITKHYTPYSLELDYTERKYFSVYNGRKIDAIREKIEEWWKTNNINDNEYYYLLASLLFAVQKVSNISGTYGAYNKVWDPRSKKPVTLKFIEVVPSKFKHEAYNQDIFEIIDKVEVETAYVDPPYNSRQYLPNYHILETIAKNDRPKIKGLTGIREYSTKRNKSVRLLKAGDIINSIYDEIRLWTIERLDFRDLIKRYDSERTFFYLDPPYHNIRGLYEYEMEDSDFIDLRDILGQIKGKYLLNINDDEFIQKIFGKSNFKKEYTNYGINGRLREKTKRIELFYHNVRSN